MLHQTKTGLGKLGAAASVAGPTLEKLHPFAVALGPAQKQTQPFLRKTTPILKNEIRPFTREIEPVVSEIQPDLQEVSEAFPKLITTLSVLNEFFNELAYNPGANQARLPVLPQLVQPQRGEPLCERRRQRPDRSWAALLLLHADLHLPGRRAGEPHRTARCSA